MNPTTPTSAPLTGQQIQAARASLSSAPQTNNGQPDSFGIETPTQSSGNTVDNMASDVGKDIENIPSDFTNAVENFGNAFGQAGTNIHTILNSNNTPGKLNSTGEMLSKTADVAGQLGSAVNKGVGAFIQPVVKDISNVTSDVDTQGQAKAQDALSSAIKPIQSQLIAASQAHPEVAKKISDALNVIGGALALSATPEDIADATTDALDKVSDTASSVVSKIKSLPTGDEPVTPTDSAPEQIASDAIKNPLSKSEQETAVGQGRASVTGPNQKVEYAPDQKTINMQNALKPLAENGDIVSPKNAGDHLNNIANTQDAITKQGADIRSALENSKATWNANELKGNLDDVKVPDPVKNETTLNKNAISLKSAALKIAQDAEKSPSGILDLRQNFDSYVKDNYGSNFFDKGRNADPFHSYVFNLRDTMNDMAGYKLPDGKLPDGTSYRDALTNQSNLINAKEAMQEKFVRENPEGTTVTSRFLKAHPTLKRLGFRIGTSIGLGALGIYGIGTAIRKGL